MNAPALMSNSELHSYVKMLARLAQISQGASRDYYATAAKELRLQADFGEPDQRSFAR